MPGAANLEADAGIARALHRHPPEPLHAGKRVAGIWITEHLEGKPGSAEDIASVDAARRERP